MRQNMSSFTTHRGVAGRLAGVFAFLVLLPGCGGGGLSEYEKVKRTQDGATEALKAQGATFRAERYPQGDAFAINLSGKQISDETFSNLLQVGNITGLNLSKTTFSDAQA